ncbi:hypothetical protein ABZ114_00245 [Streptomyces albidoflavus]|uniref:hypothetical protein n=1 Tax=Streptomyces TaxID=1883 RepID=UPI000ADD5DA4|nr:hypothetical protein [Streptomyces sp. KE1]
MALHLISVVGSGPGVGKTTLCRAVAQWLAGVGASVDHFEEADLLTRPAFRPVAAEFAGETAAVRPATLVACTRAYVAESLAAGKDHLVTDALLSFIPSLVAWGHDEANLVQVMEDLSHAVQPAQVTVVYVHDDTAADYLSAYVLEWTLHHLDLTAHLPSAAAPPAEIAANLPLILG